MFKFFAYAQNATAFYSGYKDTPYLLIIQTITHIYHVPNYKK